MDKEMTDLEELQLLNLWCFIGATVWEFLQTEGASSVTIAHSSKMNNPEDTIRMEFSSKSKPRVAMLQEIKDLTNLELQGHVFAAIRLNEVLTARDAEVKTP